MLEFVLVFINAFFSFIEVRSNKSCLCQLCHAAFTLPGLPF